MKKEVELIARFFEGQGYKAIANAILTEDNAKANAHAGLKMWYKSQVSDSYIPQQDGTFVTKQKDKKVIEEAKKIRKAMTVLIELNL